LILKLALLYHPQWLVGVAMANVPTVGAPVVIVISHHTVMQGRMPPLVSHRCWLGESLLRVDAHPGLLLSYDTAFCSLICAGPCLLRIRWPLSCKGSSLYGRGSWTAEKVPSSCGKKCLWPLHVLREVCADRDMSRTRVDAVRWDFFTKARASSCRSK
jgi:hypothetical protein